MRQFLLALFVFLSIFRGFSQESVGTANTDGTLTVKSTVAYTAPYFYVVWLKNPSGTYLRTLSMFGTNTSYYFDLTHWYSESATNKVNAVTGATKSSAGTYTSTWNAKDQANSSIVADGTYTVSIEIAGDGYSSKYVTSTFVKGTQSQTVTPTGVTPISNVSIQWVPATTGFKYTESNKYSVYPNPTRSTVYVSGFDVKGIDVLTLSGKFIFSANNQHMDLSALPKGIYIVRLTTDAGVFFKKIEKL